MYVFHNTYHLRLSIQVSSAILLHKDNFIFIVIELDIEDLLLQHFFFFQTPIYDSQITGRLGQPGVAVGLAWTTAGGEIMYVEATKIDGDGQLILTGQLGKVMKESAQLALNLVRSHMHEVQQY